MRPTVYQWRLYSHCHFTFTPALLVGRGGGIVADEMFPDGPGGNIDFADQEDGVSVHRTLYQLYSYRTTKEVPTIDVKLRACLVCVRNTNSVVSFSIFFFKTWIFDKSS